MQCAREVIRWEVISWGDLLEGSRRALTGLGSSVVRGKSESDGTYAPRCGAGSAAASGSAAAGGLYAGSAAGAAAATTKALPTTECTESQIYSLALEFSDLKLPSKLQAPRVLQKLMKVVIE